MTGVSTQGLQQDYAVALTSSTATEAPPLRGCWSWFIPRGRKGRVYLRGTGEDVEKNLSSNRWVLVAPSGETKQARSANFVSDIDQLHLLSRPNNVTSRPGGGGATGLLTLLSSDLRLWRVISSGILRHEACWESATLWRNISPSSLRRNRPRKKPAWSK
jgi:hypothetical protein